jgi:hypothetical protein
MQQEAIMTAEISPTIEPFQKQGNYFVRLFDGDIPLIVTYWVWGGLVGGLVVGGISLIIELNYAAIIVKPYGTLMVNTFFWLALAYAIFIWVAIWRSAGKYRGGSWGVVARVMVVFGIISTLGALAQWMDKESSIAEEVRMMNASLPTMLDASTRLDSLDYESEMVIYFNTIVDRTVDEFDVEYFHEIMKASIVDNLCASSDTRRYLHDGIAYAYSYADMNDARITDVIVTDVDCK